jgi:hypothetical protein
MRTLFALSGAAPPSTVTDGESRRELRLKHPLERQESLFSEEPEDCLAAW